MIELETKTVVDYYFWALSWMMINKYIIYLSINTEYKINKNIFLSRHNLLQIIMLSWVIRDLITMEATATTGASPRVSDDSDHF